MLTVELLGVVFIMLKLMGFINWHWFFVLLPLIPSVILGLYTGFKTRKELKKKLEDK